MLDTFAGTASRYGQRAVNIIAATKKWLLWSLGVSQASLKGITFEEVARMAGTQLRSVQMTLPKGAAALLQRDQLARALCALLPNTHKGRFGGDLPAPRAGAHRDEE